MIREGPQKGQLLTLMTLTLPCRAPLNKLNRAAPRDMQVGVRPPLYKPRANGESLEHLIPSRVDPQAAPPPVTPGSRYQH
jgi:hypothetical protein